MAVLSEVRDNDDTFDAEDAVGVTDKPSPTSSATVSDVVDETWDQAHRESSAYDALSRSSMSDNNEVVAMPVHEAFNPQPGFIIYPISQSPTGSWDHPWDHFQGGTDLTHQTVAAPTSPYDFTQLPTDASGQFVLVGSGIFYPEDGGYRSDSTDTVVSNSSEVSMDVNYNGIASEETRVRGRNGRYTAAAAFSDTRPYFASGTRVPSPATHVQEFDRQFGNLTGSGNTRNNNGGSSSGV